MIIARKTRLSNNEFDEVPEKQTEEQSSHHENEENEDFQIEITSNKYVNNEMLASISNQSDVPSDGNVTSNILNHSMMKRSRDNSRELIGSIASNHDILSVSEN